LAPISYKKYPSWLLYYDTIDSTNICATQRINAGMAQNGDVIWAGHQQKGRGQRGKAWEDEPGVNIAMSLIIKVSLPGSKFALLSMVVAHIVEQYLARLFPDWQTAIKWPNDIFINDKKASGILIENIWKGPVWQYSIIGIGINVHQTVFPPELLHATSLALESGMTFDLQEIITHIRSGILNLLPQLEQQEQEIISAYNQRLFRRNREVTFLHIAEQRKFQAFVQEVDQEGKLILLTSTGIERYEFGSIQWIL